MWGGYYKDMENETTVSPVKNDSVDVSSSSLSEPSVINKGPYTKKMVFSIFLVVVLVVLFCLLVVKNKATTIEVVPSSPITTDLNKELPPHFSENISIKSDSDITESYKNEYIENFTQESVTVASTIPAQENFIYYRDVLQKSGWVFQKNTDMSQVASSRKILEATRGSSTISVIVFDEVLIRGKATSTAVNINEKGAILSSVVINLLFK